MTTEIKKVTVTTGRKVPNPYVQFAMFHAETTIEASIKKEDLADGVAYKWLHSQTEKSNELAIKHMMNTEELRHSNRDATPPPKTQGAPADHRPQPTTTKPKCPKCGKELRERTGTKGNFLACPGYPKCKHTEQVR